MNNEKSNGGNSVDKPIAEDQPSPDKPETAPSKKVEKAEAKAVEGNADAGVTKTEATKTDTDKTDTAKTDFASANQKGGSSKSVSKSPLKDQSTRPSKTKEKSNGSPLIKALKVLLLLLMITGLAAGGWWFYQNQNQNQTQVQAQKQIQPTPVQVPVNDSENEQKAQIDRLEVALKNEQQERQRQHLELNQVTDELQLSISSHARRLRELSTTSRKDWLLAEAEYLIRLANQRLITERNTKNATTLMITADEILRDLDEVDLFPVRRELAKSITALKMAESVDREGLYLKLSALSEQAVSLPLMSPELLEGDRVKVSVEPMEDEGWRGQLSRSFSQALDGFNDLVRVRHRDAPLKPLLAVEDEQFVRHNLGILLEQSKLALLREEQAIYQNSLTRAQQWLETYFELNDGAKELAAELSQLSEENIVQALPDISGGLESLRDFIDSWHKRHPVDKAGTTDGDPL